MQPTVRSAPASLPPATPPLSTEDSCLDHLFAVRYAGTDCASRLVEAKKVELEERVSYNTAWREYRWNMRDVLHLMLERLMHSFPA